MRKLIIFSIIVLVSASYASMQTVDSISKPATCMKCHGSKHLENSLYLRHLDVSVNCIECHSGEGVRGYVEARKELVNVILLEKASPAINYVFRNITYNNSIHLQANCTKCHELVKGMPFNHSAAANCTLCHKLKGTIEQPETGFWKKMGIGGHRNKSCEDCHTTGFRIPECTSCHISHRDGVNLNNSECLACHNSPHIPARNGSFSGDIAKENCGACHKNAYDTLTFYNSKHNQSGSCISCHPAHGALKRCFDCHGKEHVSHPYARDNCAGCHGKATCKECHKEPHAPLRGLAKITTQEQFNDYAASRRNN